MEEYIRKVIATGEIADGNKLSNFIWSDANVVEEIDEGEHHRWYYIVSYIFELDGKYYSIYEERGSTEHQETEIPDQEIVEVEKVPITTYEWRSVKS